MNKYELTVILPAKTTAAKKKSSQEKIEKLVLAFEGKVGKIADWGEVDLTYPIKKNSTGVFLNIDLELSKDSVKKLSEKLKMEDGIIRYLLVKKDE